MKENHLSIWFIIGLQLVVMGAIILAVSIYGIFVPPANPVLFQDSHPGVYEGVAILGLGIFYTFKFRPVGKK
jgi:FtsH-binding integral membrane protein